MTIRDFFYLLFHFQRVTHQTFLFSFKLIGAVYFSSKSLFFISYFSSYFSSSVFLISCHCNISHRLILVLARSQITLNDVFPASCFLLFASLFNYYSIYFHACSFHFFSSFALTFTVVCVYIFFPAL